MTVMPPLSLIFAFRLTTLTSFPLRLVLLGSCLTQRTLSYPLSSLKTQLDLSDDNALTSHALLRSEPKLSSALALNRPLPFSPSPICPLRPIDLFIKCEKTR